VLVGSLRKDSFNRKMARAVMAMAPAELSMRFVEIGELPLYNPDLETVPPPAAWQALRDAVRPAHGLLFVTPEYNRGVTAALKNAVDVGSRPPGQNVWAGKPAGVISVTQGMLGAFGANHALRQSLVTVGVATLPAPEMYVGQAATLFDEQGALVNDRTRELVTKFLAALGKWIARNAP
jgi:chromate reductase